MAISLGLYLNGAASCIGYSCPLQCRVIDKSFAQGTMGGGWAYPQKLCHRSRHTEEILANVWSDSLLGPCTLL